MFSMRDVYPDFPVVETTEKTIPAAQAQQRQDPNLQGKKVLVTQEERNRVWLGIIILVIVMLLLNLKY